MEENELFEYISSVYTLKQNHVYIASEVLASLNERNHNYQYVEYIHFKKIIEDKYGIKVEESDYDFVLDKLEYDLYLIEKHYDDSRYKISLSGKELFQVHDNLLEYFESEINKLIEKSIEQKDEKDLKKQIDNLTLKQLKGTIFQVNKWWLIIIINAFVSIAVAVLVAIIVKKIGI